MIRTEREYTETQQRLEELRTAIQAQEVALKERGLSLDDIELAMDHLYSFKAQMEDEASAYEHARTRNFLPVHRFDEIGELLMALRIGSGLSQRDLAARLGVQESQVSRDENNEYHNVKVERAQNVLDVLLDELGMELVICVEPRIGESAYYLGDEGFNLIADTSQWPGISHAQEFAIEPNQLMARELAVLSHDTPFMYGEKATWFAPLGSQLMGTAISQGTRAVAARDAAAVA